MTWAAEKIGSGPQSFVWLHGWGQTHSSLSRLAGLFAAEGTHWLLDQPGFGETPMLHRGAGTADYADALADQWSELGLNAAAILVCHSFGARVATQLAARHPDRVKALVYIGGAGLKRPRSLAFKVRALGLKLIGRLARLMDGLFGTQYQAAYRSRFGSADYKAAGDLRETFVAVVNEDLISEAEQIRVPTLLLYGSEDTETPPVIGERYQSLIPEAQLQILDGLGHLDILDRGVYQVESYLRPFLQDLDP